MELKAIKFGVSEHKRKNYLDFYFSAAKSFYNLQNLSINKTDLIYKELFKNGVYQREKDEKNISRELVFFKNAFPLYEVKNEKIQITQLTKNILKQPSTKVFKGKTYLENALIIYLIQQHKEELKNNNPFIHAINLSKNKNLRREEFTKNIFEMNKSKIINNFNNLLSDELIRNYFSFGSGIPNVNNDQEIKDFQNKRDNLINLLIKNILYKKNNDEIILENLFNLIKNYENLQRKKKLGSFPKTYKKIFKFDRKNNKFESFILNYEKGNVNQYLNTIKNLTLENLIDHFYYENKRNDYCSLIQRYLFLTDFFIIKNGFIKLNKIYESYISELENNYTNILKISIKDNDVIESLKNIGIIDEEKEYYPSIREIINDYYNDSFYDTFFTIISNDEIKIINNDLIKLGNENEHMNGILDAPTIFEFIINLFFFKIFYGSELLDKDNYSDEELTKIFKESVNTYLSTNLIPLRFASGNRSDAIFRDEKILIEPTLEMNKQVKHELESIVNHLKKVNFNSSVLVAPKISDNFLPQVIAYKNFPKNPSVILPFDVSILIKLKNSNYSKDLFNIIKQEFWSCNSYNDVVNIMQKYK